MKDEDKTKEYLIQELVELRQRVAELETSEMERRQMWEELEAEKSKMGSIMNSIASGIDIISYDYRIQYQNKFLLDRFGDIRGKLCYKEYMNRDRPCSDCPMRRAIENNGAERAELIGGNGRNVEVLSTSIQNPDGTMSAVEVITDITERKRAEEALRESEEKFRTFMETANDLMHIADKDGNLTYVNESMAETLGYSREEMIGMHIRQILRKEFVEKKFKQKGEELITKGGFSLEPTWVRKDGKEIYGEVKVVAIYDRDGKFAGARGVFRDITERKRAEQALREREAELEIRTNSLEEVNTALSVLLKRRDEDKTELEQKVLANMKQLVVPFLEKLKKSPLDPKQVAYLHILESNLNAIISPFLRTLSAKYVSLTPTEIQVANLIKEGKNTKETATLLNLSSKTINTHRRNIRMKLGIKNKKVNLRSHLLSLQH